MPRRGPSPRPAKSARPCHPSNAGRPWNGWRRRGLRSRLRQPDSRLSCPRRGPPPRLASHGQTFYNAAPEEVQMVKSTTGFSSTAMGVDLLPFAVDMTPLTKNPWPHRTLEFADAPGGGAMLRPTHYLRLAPYAAYAMGAAALSATFWEWTTQPRWHPSLAILGVGALAAGLLTSLGILRPKPVYFDMSSRNVFIGTPRASPGSSSAKIPLDDIAAVQLLEGMRRGRVFWELNLVLSHPPGARRTLLAHCEPSVADDANRIAVLLSKPLIVK